MRSTSVVVSHESRQPDSALSAIGIGTGVSPLPQAGLDETLRLTIGLRTVRTGKAMLDSQSLAGPGEGKGAVGTTVIGQQPANGHPQGLIVRHRRLQEGDGRVLAFIWMYLHKGDP